MQRAPYTVEKIPAQVRLINAADAIVYSDIEAHTGEQIHVRTDQGKQELLTVIQSNGSQLTVDHEFQGQPK